MMIRLDHVRDGDVLVIQVSGRLDGGTAPGLRHLLDDRLATAPRGIVLDLSSLSVLEPGAVQALDHVARHAREADIGLSLVTVDGAVIRALVTTCAAGLFDLYPTTEAARRALR